MMLADFRLSGALLFLRTLADRPAGGSHNSSVIWILLVSASSVSPAASVLGECSFFVQLQQRCSGEDNSKGVGVEAAELSRVVPCVTCVAPAESAAVASVTELLAVAEEVPVTPAELV